MIILKTQWEKDFEKNIYTGRLILSMSMLFNQADCHISTVFKNFSSDLQKWTPFYNTVKVLIFAGICWIFVNS